MTLAEYAAPEQLMGQATFASDLYSLGVTCIHLLTGLSPFELFDGAAGVWRWRVVAGAVDNHLAQILDRLLAMNLSDRYPSAAAVLQDLGVTIKSELQPALRLSVLRSGLVAKAAETQQWSCVATVETGLEVAAIALSADGKTVATAAAISPNGETLVTGSSDRTIQVWQCQDGKILQTLTGHTDTVTAFAFSPDGTRLYSGSRDRTIQVWDLGTGQTMTTLTGHKGAVVALALDGDRHPAPVLRLYEGCALRTIGRPEEANVIKFHSRKPKITYLVYPNFDTDPHPASHTSMQIDLRDLHVHYRDYETDDNPPILHQKHLLVAPDYPGYEKFAKLSRQEEDWGLFEDWNRIGTRQGWQKCLTDHCAELKGHRVVWRKDADPYRVKLLKSAQRQRSSGVVIKENPQTEQSNPDSRSLP